VTSLCDCKCKQVRCVGEVYYVSGKLYCYTVLCIQLKDNLLANKNYTDLKKAAEDKNVWRTIRRGCHKLAPQADN